MNVTLLCLILSVTSYAQTLTPFAGMALSSTSFDEEATDAKFQSGIVAGLGFEIPVGEKMLSALVECKYVGKGYLLDYNFHPSPALTQRGEITFKHNYLEVPVLLKASFLEGPVQIYANAGAYVAIGLGGTMSGKLGYYDEDDDGSLLFYEEYDGEIFYGESNFNEKGDYGYESRMDYGFSLGGGVLLFKKVMVDIRYDLGLVDLNGALNEKKNKSLQFTVGVPLQLGGK